MISYFVLKKNLMFYYLLQCKLNLSNNKDLTNYFDYYLQKFWFRAKALHN